MTSPAGEPSIVCGNANMHRCFLLVICICSAAVFVSAGRADVPLPPNVMNPATVNEAWNVIRLTRVNVARLLEEKRVAEVPEQVSLCSPALRLLARANMPAEKRPLIDEQTTRAFRSVNSVAQACMVRSPPDADKAFAELQSALTALESAFDSREVGAEIYYCLAHPDIISTTAGSTCRKCGAPLRLRRIPYSFIYVSPGTPTIKLGVENAGPLAAGKEIEIKVHLTTTAGAPVSESDLLIVHAHPIHLLISDPALDEFQIIHPAPATTPGVYTFSLTPKTSSPLRIWADIVPIATGLQELPFADLGGTYVPAPRTDTADVLSSTVDGFTLQLTFAGGNGQARARQIQLMRVSVADASGQPVQTLEPFMNAFAHVVGFYDDHQTVLRLHPAGGDILREDVRGGPHLGFKLYPPRAGLIRFFGQVRIDGRTITAPFTVNVAD